jgi:hypothetical protein
MERSLLEFKTAEELEAEVAKRVDEFWEPESKAFTCTDLHGARWHAQWMVRFPVAEEIEW